MYVADVKKIMLYEYLSNNKYEYSLIKSELIQSEFN